MRPYHFTFRWCVGAALTLTVAASCAPSSGPTLPSTAIVIPTPSISPPSPPVGLAIVIDGHVIAGAQRSLRALGYDPGEADGISGSATRKAILAFQKDHGLRQDGLLSTVVIDKLRASQGDRVAVVSVDVGDTLIYDDKSTETVALARELRWEQKDGARSLVAVRPATKGWPAAARLGLDWATTHALDGQTLAPSTRWSSSGVDRQFEIKIFATLSPREVALVGSASQDCRRFEIRAGERHRYPGLACRDAKGEWNIPHSHIRIARPAVDLGPQPDRRAIHYPLRQAPARQ
jgi:peptidoglycan hydrolase-like protein with peptidoglycan-binding domain